MRWTDRKDGAITTPPNKGMNLPWEPPPRVDTSGHQRDGSIGSISEHEQAALHSGVQAEDRVTSVACRCDPTTRSSVCAR